MGWRKMKALAPKKDSYRPVEDETEEIKRAPHSFVIHRGSVGVDVNELTNDLRKVMEPFTASELRVRKNNKMRDFVSISGMLNVSHILMFSSTRVGTYLKIARLPQGPTLTFWVHNYSLAKDVLSLGKTQYVFEKLYKNSPLIVLNNFSGEEIHMKLMTSMLQNLFPTININKVQLKDIRRCVLMNYNVETKEIDFRHYAIKAVPVGVSKGVKKLIQSKVPDLGRCEDISELITKSGQLSESEAEDDETSHVTLPQNLASRGNKASGQSALRLKEIGPRLTLQLKKIEQGLLNGEILFHEIVIKTEEEIKKIKEEREEKRELKEKRKRIQEENVRKKKELKEKMKQKSLKGMQKKSEYEKEMQKALGDPNEVEDEDDDDAEWYRKEVGEEPDEDLFDPVQKKRKSIQNGPMPKRWKKDFKTKNETHTKHKMKSGFDKKQRKYSTHSEQEFHNKPTIRNKFGRKKNKTIVSQTNQFKKKKVFGSKTSKKHK